MLRGLRVVRILHVLPPPCLWRTDVTSFAFCRSPPSHTEGKAQKKGPRSPQKALQKVLLHVRRSQQGPMVVRQRSRCALRGHCPLRVMSVWFCCASGIRPGVYCAFCACYALHESRFRPSFGGQHPVFRVVQAPVRVKEEPPDTPEHHAEPEGDPDTETAAEGKMTDGGIHEV